MLTPELVKKMLDAIAAEDGKAALSVLTEVVAAEAAGGAADTAEPAAASADPLAASADPAKPKPGEGDTAATALTALSKKVADLEASITTVRASASDVELTERRGLVAELVKLGVELPARAWLERSKDSDPLVPCKRLSDEPIAELRTRVAELRTARGIQPTRAHETPERGADAGSVTEAVKKLSARQLDAIKARGMTPEQFIQQRSSAVKRV
jgi:hypothetical protein